MVREAIKDTMAEVGMILKMTSGRWSESSKVPLEINNVQDVQLYSITTNKAAIIALFRVINRYIGNLPPMPGVLPELIDPVRALHQRDLSFRPLYSG